MAQPDTLEKRLSDLDALELSCPNCGHRWQFGRTEAFAAFGRHATPYIVQTNSYCPLCKTPAAGVRLVPDLKARREAWNDKAAPFPTSAITFAVCQLAGWMIEGDCPTCGGARILYSPGQRKPPRWPDLRVGWAFKENRLVCGKHKPRVPFAAVRIVQVDLTGHHIIASWSTTG